MPSIKTVLRHSEVVDLCHLHTCKLIAPVPCTCGWCEGRRAASPPGYSHAGAEEAVGPPGWQGPAAVTVSPAQAACAGLSLTEAGSAGLAALLAHTEPSGAEVVLGEGGCFCSSLQGQQPACPTQSSCASALGTAWCCSVLVGRSPAQAVAIVLLKLGSLQPLLQGGLPTQDRHIQSLPSL